MTPPSDANSAHPAEVCGHRACNRWTTDPADRDSLVPPYRPCPVCDRNPWDNPADAARAESVLRKIETGRDFTAEEAQACSELFPGSADPAEICGPYGTVTAEGNSVNVTATHDQLWAWANRPGNLWPCSELTMLDEITAWIDRDSGDLIDLSIAPDHLSGTELTAWIDDTLAGTPFARNPETV